MQFAILTAVIAAIAAAESGEEPVEGIAWRLLVVLLATLAAPLAALLGTQRLVATVGLDDERQDAIARLQSAVICLWLAAVGAILLIGRWPQIVRGNWRLAAWPLVDELAILLPVLAPLLFIWAALYRLDRATQIAACRARHIAAPPPRLATYLVMQARHHLGLILIPPLIIVGILELLGAAGISAARLDTAWWLAFPLIATVLVLMPVAVRHVWRTRPLAGSELRLLLDDVCRGRRCLVRDILIWDTDRSLANAAVVGMSRWLRYVLLTDVLVARLSDHQIAAVVRHELAHLRRWHLPLRLALLLAPVAWWLAIEHARPDLLAIPQAALQSVAIRPQLAAACILPLGMLAYALLVVGSFSRMLEHDADLDACQPDERSTDRNLTEDFCTALATLCGGARESRLSQWLHPATASRIAFVRHVQQTPQAGAAFRRRFQLLASGVLLLYLAAGLVALCG